MAGTDQQQHVETVSDDTSGGVLLRAREQKELTAEDIAGRLHLATSIITAIEQDDDEQLPSPIYVRGYLRSYATMVGLSPDTVIDLYNQRVDLKVAPIDLQINSRPGKKACLEIRKRPVSRIAAGIVIALVVILGLTMLVDSDAPEEPEKQVSKDVMPVEKPATVDKTVKEAVKEKLETVPASSSEPVVAAAKLKQKASVEPEKPAVIKTVSTAAGDDVLQISFSHASWVVVHDANDARLLFRTAKAGKLYRLKGSKPFRIFLGNADAARLMLNGESFDHLGYKRKNSTARFIVGEVVKKKK